jgi:TonB family protein
MYRIAIRSCSLFLLIAFAGISGSAQSNSCDLGLKVFSYDAAEEPRSRVMNAKVRLRGKGLNKSMTLGTGPSNEVFTGLSEGSYELEFTKPGYTKRRKTVNLNCAVKDQNNAVWNHTYLWRDKKSSGVDADLVEDERDDSGNLTGTAGIGSVDVARAADDKLAGSVTIKILIDEDGNVLSASRVEGDTKLAERAILMARRAKFTPALVSGSAKQVSHNVTYNFGP